MNETSNNSAKKLTSKKSFFSLSLSKWKNSNEIWIKSPDFFDKHPFNNVPSLEIVISKKGSFIINKHKRIFDIYEDKIVIFKSKEEKNARKIHAMIPFDDQLLIHWLYKKNKKPNNKEDFSNRITGFNLLKGSRFLRFQSSDPKSLFFLKEHLKYKLKFTNFNDEFTLIKMIGRGSFSSVYLAENLNSKQYFAIKAFNKRSYYATPNGKDSVANEILCMRKTSSHPNIIKLYEVFETHHSIYLVLEMISGGNLQDRLNEKKQYTEKMVKGIIKGVFEGLSYIHSMNVMHRDIKPSNIILRTDRDEEHDVCIADFGLATPLDVASYLFYRCGTPGFAGPEIIENGDPNKKYDAVCDVFSAGAVFHYLLTGKPVFKSKIESLLYLNKRCEIDFNARIFKKISGSALDLLKKTLEKNPEKRISAKEALQHPFFKDLKKMDSSTYLFIPEEKYEKCNPTSRLTLNENFSNEKRNGLSIITKVIEKNFITMTDKSYSFANSKHNLEDLMTNTPVLNGHLDTIEFSESGGLKSNHFIGKHPKGKASSFSRSLPKFQKKDEEDEEEQGKNDL